MGDLLNYPEVQSVVLPFAAALVVAIILLRSGLGLAGLGMIVGFVITVVFVNGVELLPLTATRKIIIAGLAGTLVGALADRQAWGARNRLAVFTGLSVLAAAWVMGIALLRQSGVDLLSATTGTLAYVVWIVYWTEKSRTRPLRAESGAVGFGLGTGLIAIMGSSALLGQLALAVSAASAGVLAALLLQKKDSAGAALTLPASGLLGLIGCAVVAFASLPWLALLILSLAPMAAYWVPVRESWPRWLQAAVVTITTVAVTGIALIYAWSMSDTSSGGY